MNTPPAAEPRPRHIEPLWQRVDRNRWRLAGYLVGFWVVSTLWTALAIWFGRVAVWLFLIYNGAEPTDLAGSLDATVPFVTAALISLVYVWWSLARSDRVIRGRLGAEFVPKGELLDTKMAVKDMAIAAGLPVAPALYRINTRNVNAFVFHAFGHRPILGITDGLAERLTIDEQRAVFANLTARIVTRDVLVVSAVAALMVPLQIWRDYRLNAGDYELEMLTDLAEESPAGGTLQSGGSSPLGAVMLLLPFGFALVLLGEALALGFRRSQLSAAEKADAEGMLLLKHPAAMLSALDKAVRFNNNVPTAGEMYGPLFYCWTGDSTDDEDDPEWRRVSRLREVLGAEGCAIRPSHDVTRTPVEGFAPPAPRLSESE